MAVRLKATITPRAIIVVISENFKLVSIIFPSSYPHTKSELAHFCTKNRKNLPGFRAMHIFALPLCPKIGQNPTLI
ncbi:hypothetical protein B8P98_12505 [Klebsiella quasivariicola]|nr:hypothetical protein B8P98_12505 [Klebsiella quasivariicola]